MDRSLCKAVKEGNCEKVRELARNNPQILKTVTPLGNTALHVAASRKDHKLAELLLSLKPCIILMRNVNQETALHKAAAAGCLEVVQLLLDFKNGVRCNSSECAHPDGYDLEGCRLDPNDLWRAPNLDNETALHYAARGDYPEIASALLKKVKDIELILNKAGESALYTACEGGSWRAAVKLGERDSISDTRQDKQTCLHQLLTIDGHCYTDIALYLLGKRPALAEKADAAGNFPLHLASIRGNRRIVEELLKRSPDTALQKNKDGMAAIHYAARKGHEDIVSCLIDYVPDCTEVLGKDNKNALHFALEYGRISAAKTLLSESMDPSFLINHADRDGQTALHKVVEDPELASEMLSPMLKISRWNVNAADNNGLATLDVAEAKIMTVMKSSYRKQLRKCGAHRKEGISLKRQRSRSSPLLERSPQKDGKVKKDDGDNLSVIATLVFTVTFAAALTVPGGFRTDNGVPVWMHATAFQCFIVSDTLAFCLSILAMFILTIKSRDKQEVSVRIHGFILFRAKYYRGYLYFLFGNIGCRFNGQHMVSNAINATLVAFITGVYVTVAPKYLWLALTVCTMGVFTVFIYFLMLAATPTINRKF
ncbi:hypothetical protein SUGI_0440730 [Cryptomeria japonica]|uniref:ankyrin repeat-containing protein NPR4 n=1 Tax=Cryptomeria japonica TaxID=3369 RepID=UPI002408D6D4|nr:ankyrin repeat-containing protein NPR4 [Cryptomeria japonica]GLJ23297.1 hypothetical protein SUGI_0440730 [Cryptomeria japonica]